MLSIVIPTYNCAAYVGDAVRSCLQQSRQDDWELIVVDDGSTDETQRVLSSFAADTRVRVLWQDNAGSAAARNLGIEQSHGDFLAFLDADDLYHPRTVERLKAAIPSLPPTVGFAYCDYARVDSSGVAPQPVSVRGPLNRPQLFWQYLLPGWFPVLTSTTLVRRETLLSVGLFDPSFRLLQDLELWTRVIPSWDVAKISWCTTFRRTRPGQVTENKAQISAYRERCNTKFLSSHPFSLFSGTNEPVMNANLAEWFGDLFLGATRPLPQSAYTCYHIARSFMSTPVLEAKISAIGAAGISD